jgi:hypothetical protein
MYLRNGILNFNGHEIFVATMKPEIGTKKLIKKPSDEMLRQLGEQNRATIMVKSTISEDVIFRPLRRKLG